MSDLVRARIRQAASAVNATVSTTRIATTSQGWSWKSPM